MNRCGPRALGVRLVEQRDGAGRVADEVDHAQAGLADADLVAVAHQPARGDRQFGCVVGMGDPLGAGRPG